MEVTTQPAALPRVEAMLDEARAHNDADRPEQAKSRAEAALTVLSRITERSPEIDDLRARLLRVLSYSQGRLGDIDNALALLDLALTTDRRQEAEIAGARAVLLLNIGRFDEAVLAFDEAIPSIPTSDPRSRIAALANRGVAHLSTGALAEAQSDTEAAATLAAAEVPSWQAGIRHNLGYIQFLQGDLCGALDSMAAAAELLPPSAQGVPALDRSRVLLAAGLITEAAASAETALATFTENHAVHDMAASLLVRAEIALLDADPAAADRWARRSASISRRRSNDVNVLLAELLIVRARAMTKSQRARGPQRRHSAADAARALDLATRFDAVNLHDQAGFARLIAAEALLDAGETDRAGALLAQAAGTADTEPPVPDGALTTGTPDGSVASADSAMTTRLHRQYVAGRLEFAGGRTTAGLDRLAVGLDELATFQARFGSQDLQAAAAIHGRNLARLGLRTAVGTMDPELMLEWLDRARAVSTRLPALRPPADPELAAVLGSLRVASATALTARLAGEVDGAAEATVAELRGRARSRAWTSSAVGTVDRPVGLAAARSALTGRDGSQLLAVFSGAGRVHAILVSADGARYLPVGELEPLLVAARTLAADLDVLAMDRMPSPIRAVATGSLDRQLTLVDELLQLDHLVPPGSPGTLTVVAAGEIATLPWGLLPSLRGRAVRINASVTAATRSVGQLAAADRPGSVLAVRGPQIPRGDDELDGITGSYPDLAVLTGEEATGEAVIAGVADVDLLHVIAHGIHEPDNPEFSGVLLAGGPLFAYDLAPLPRLPRQVVLSSCDVGRSTDRPGGEPLGLTAALLRFGVPTVVAGTARISDRAAAAVMPAYHREIAGGSSPAVALARALRTVEEPVAISCFGA